jgi:zona occludens toxin
MIYLYSGTPGSGKSYHMASDIYWRCRTGKPTIANFDVSLKRGQKNFTCMDNSELSPLALKQYAAEYFKDHPFREGAIRLYWDECQVLLGARSWNAKDRADWVIFFTQHRKWGYDVVLVTQFDKMLDKQIRALIEYECQHRKVNNIGKFGFIVSVFTFGKPVFVCNRYYYGMKYRLGSDWLLGSKHIFKIYDTRATFQNLSLEES